jgi:hypothetical protein
MAHALIYLTSWIVFVLVASPMMYRAVRRVLGAWVASPEGLATPAGLALHGVVYILVVGIIMSVFKKNLK